MKEGGKEVRLVVKIDITEGEVKLCSSELKGLKFLFIGIHLTQISKTNKVE